MGALLVLSIATALGVVVQTVAGFGFLFFLTPALLLYFTPPVAVTISLLAGNTLSLLVLFAERRRREVSTWLVVKLLIVAVPGLLLGAFLITVVPKHVLQLIVGVMIIAAALIQQFVFPKPTTGLRFSAAGALSGLTAGVLNSSTSMGGPPLALWLRSHRTTRNQVRDTLAAVFLGLNCGGIASILLFSRHALTSRGVVVSVLLIPVIIVAHVVGRRLAARINAEQYRHLVLGAVIAAGVFSIVAGLRL